MPPLNTGITQKLNFLVAAIEEHKTAIRQELDALRSEVSLLKAEQNQQKAAEAKTSKQRKKIPTELSVSY